MSRQPASEATELEPQPRMRALARSADAAALPFWRRALAFGTGFGIAIGERNLEAAIVRAPAVRCNAGRDDDDPRLPQSSRGGVGRGAAEVRHGGGRDPPRGHGAAAPRRSDRAHA